MFIVFEGIDGSGKTTVSNRVAQALRKRGIDIDHIREDGKFASTFVGRMRAFGKDTRNVAMAPLTELLFYGAREAQLATECIRPALDRGAIVFADRYLYSYEVLSHYGRGMPRPKVKAVLDLIANDLWPDLVVLLDADPHIARARRRTSKIIRKGKEDRIDGSSRKGLGGAGLQHRMRSGYLAIASENPDLWLVLDNSDIHNSLDATVSTICDAIVELIAKRPNAALIRDATARLPPKPKTLPSLSSFAEGKQAFYQAIEVRAKQEPNLAAYLLAKLIDDTAFEWRNRLTEISPKVIAFGLRGIDDERAWVLREKLADAAPYLVVRSVDGAATAGPRADAIRERFIDVEPKAVISTLDGNDSDTAWAIRDRLCDDFLRETVSSTKRLNNDRAWALRERYLAQHGGTDGPMTRSVATTLANSLRGVAGEHASQLRRLCYEVAPIPTLRSLAGIQDEESWICRLSMVERAAKIVFSTLVDIDDPRAWSLRKQYAATVKEALSSMIGLDTEDAWTIRRDCADIWPSETIKSLGRLALRPRGQQLVLDILTKHANNIAVLKHVTRIEQLLAENTDWWVELSPPNPQR